jgi:hypothetical protein
VSLGKFSNKRGHLELRSRASKAADLLVHEYEQEARGKRPHFMRTPQVSQQQSSVLSHSINSKHHHRQQSHHAVNINSIKDKISLEQSMNVQRWSIGSSTLSLTSALYGGGLLTPRPGCLIHGKETRYPLYRRLGGPEGRSEPVRKISTPPGFDPRIVQPVTSRYTD